ncbi:MAG: hypothetical protein EBR30_10310 [Cytophagia bacterium]|nr:hypothetical protein [Cytophagia bacterium]NBW35391.1 hypothetical protein [Cytophagia bacterium]
MIKAQGLEGLEGQTNLQMLSGSGMSARTFDNRYEGVDGFPTLVKDFVKGRIKMNKDQVVKADKMNYDVFHDEIFVLKSGKELVVGTSVVTSFEMDVNGTTMLFSKQKNEDGETGYFQVLTQGNFSLFIKHKKIFRKADYQGAYSANRTKDEFLDEQKFYWSKGDSNLMVLKNKKSLLNELGAQAEKAESFIKTNKLKLDSQDHLLGLFQYLNEQ